MTEKLIPLKEGKSQPISYCKICGNVFRIYKQKPDAKHCSLECRLKATAFTEDQIETIKRYRVNNKSYSFISRELGIPRQTITRYCQQEGLAVTPHLGHVEANRRTAKVKKQNADIKPVFVCLNCGRLYVHERWDDLGLLYCSRHCSDYYRNPPQFVDYREITRRLKEKEENRPRCEICGIQLSYSFQKVCYKCKPMRDEQYYLSNIENWKAKNRQRYRKEKELELLKRKCVVCGKGFETWFPKKECCSPKCGKKRAHQSRRAQEKEAFIEHVDLRKIFFRDKARCQFCGKKLNLRRKTPHPLSAVRDHIVPLAKGGEHSYKNVQLSCFMCNSLKGDRIVEGYDQLRLF